MTTKPQINQEGKVNRRVEVRDALLTEEVKVIQGVIERMASNTRHLKSMAVFIVTMLCVLPVLPIAAVVPVLAFWYLDAYYLRMQRIYVKAHNLVVEYRPKWDDDLFNLNPTRFDSVVDSVWSIMGSPCVSLFYSSMLGVIAAFTFIRLG